MHQPLLVTIEELAEQHPALNVDLLQELARVALARYHTCPADFIFHHGDGMCIAKVAFDSPDARSQATLEREDFVEKGAIVLAGVLLHQFEGKQITRVTQRGSHVDYFVGETPGDCRWILEVGGTDKGSFAGLRARKRQQLESSPYRFAPHGKHGFVSVTRFAPEAEAASDFVPSA